MQIGDFFNLQIANHEPYFRVMFILPELLFVASEMCFADEESNV